MTNDPIQSAIAAAYADAARAVKIRLGKDWLSWAAQSALMAAYKDILARAEAVAANTALIGVEPWSPPHFIPDGFECLAQNMFGTWKHVRWQWGRWTIVGDQTMAVHNPTAFATLPTAKETQTETEYQRKLAQKNKDFPNGF